MNFEKDLLAIVGLFILHDISRRCRILLFSHFATIPLFRWHNQVVSLYCPSQGFSPETRQWQLGRFGPENY